MYRSARAYCFLQLVFLYTEEQGGGGGLVNFLEKRAFLNRTYRQNGTHQDKTLKDGFKVSDM
jgi:hypothetical protein